MIFHCYPIFEGEKLLGLLVIVWMLGVCCLACVFSFVGQGLEVFLWIASLFFLNSIMGVLCVVLRFFFIVLFSIIIG